jgi:polysaccharide deacetylase family sporulation protein PdaB
MWMRVWAPSRRVLRRAAVALWGALVAGALGVAARVVAPTVATVAAMDRYSLRDVRTDQRALALTFDISWGTVMPQKVLTILVREHVPATFFLSGPWAAQHPDYVRTLVRDGFEVESHGWAHVNFSGLGYDGVVANIRRADAVLRELTGRPVRFIRPPNGDFNRTSLAAARSLGYTTVTWDTDSWDWMNPGVDTIVRRVVERAHPGDIVLLHASDTCKQTDAALPVIVRDLRGKGFHLVTLEDLLRLGEPDYRG